MANRRNQGNEQIPETEVREVRADELQQLVGDDVEVIDLSNGRKEVKDATWHL